MLKLDRFSASWVRGGLGLLLMRRSLMLMLVLLIVACATSAPKTKEEAISAVLKYSGISAAAVNQPGQSWQVFPLSDDVWSVTQSGYVQCPARYGPGVRDLERRWHVWKDGRVILVSSQVPCFGEYYSIGQ